LCNQKEVLETIPSSYRATSDLLGSGFVYVYVLTLHAVQLGNDWMEKIPRTARIGSRVQIIENMNINEIEM